jgi:hypothetical protein
VRPPVAEPLHPKGWIRPAGNQDFRVTQDWDDIDPVYPSVRHRALDLGDGNVDLDNLFAPAPGEVIAVGYLREPWSASSNAYGTGNFGGLMVVIRQDDGYTSALAHLTDTIVKVGQPVLRGQVLGRIGDSGAAKGRGSHVHWDVYAGVPRTWAERESMKRDPWPLLDQNQTVPDTGTVPPGDTDMRFGGAEVVFSDDFPKFRLTDNANFRADAEKGTASASFKIFPAGTAVGAFPFTVKGQALSTGDRWQPALMYVDTAYISGFFHASVVEQVNVADDLQAALDAEKRRTATVKATAVSGLKSHSAALEGLADKISAL